MPADEFGPARELRQRLILDQSNLGPVYWYHHGKKAAVVLTIDDVFPGTRGNPYEAGGDLEKGALGRLLWLLNRHPQLHITLFVTPDWRQISPTPHLLWRHVPWLRDRVYLASILPKGTMELRKSPALVVFLNAMPRTDIALHGLSHIHRAELV